MIRTTRGKGQSSGTDHQWVIGKMTHSLCSQEEQYFPWQDTRPNVNLKVRHLLVSRAAPGPWVTISILDSGFWPQSRTVLPAMAGVDSKYDESATDNALFWGVTYSEIFCAH